MAAADRRPPPIFRDEAGQVSHEFANRVAAAIEARDALALTELVGDLHEADLGDLIGALSPELRPRLIEVLGMDGTDDIGPDARTRAALDGS